ncbi:SAM-dependent methyltransferase [Sphaerisporangium flaviroseum]|uniref:SAM-dependent methyltransferase n=1 Tax=Sphaerisporangium flaviroseum TaxID=509199 RepID=UPI003CD06C0E
MSRFRLSRLLLGRAVRYLAAEAGIRRLLDIGSGLPTQSSGRSRRTQAPASAAPSRRERARDCAPGCRAPAGVLPRV